MSINFTGKLIVDDSIYSLGSSDPKQIVELAKRVLDSPKIQKILPDDIVLSGKSLGSGDVVEFSCGTLPYQVCSRGGVNPGTVIQQILMMICEKHGKTIKLSEGTDFPSILEVIKEIIKENSAKIN